LSEPDHIRASLFLICAPSGAGKTSLVKELLMRHPEIYWSVSLTTRPRRRDERDGIDYHFISAAEFQQAIARDAFLEHAEVFGQRYGTAREEVENALAQGRDVILEIDWQGAQQVREKMPGSISVFILPPSLGALEQRLRDRGQDSPTTIARRLAEARDEISHWREFDYLVVNDDFDTALAELHAIVIARRVRRQAQCRHHADLLRSLLAAKKE